MALCCAACHGAEQIVVGLDKWCVQDEACVGHAWGVAQWVLSRLPGKRNCGRLVPLSTWSSPGSGRSVLGFRQHPLVLRGFWPNLDQVRPTWPTIVATSGQSLARWGRVRQRANNNYPSFAPRNHFQSACSEACSAELKFDFDGVWPDAGQVLPSLGQLRPHMPEFRRIRAHFGQPAKLGQRLPFLATYARTWINFGKPRPNSVKVWAIFASNLRQI